MRLLLTHAYFLAEDPKEQRIMKPYPPLGILYIASHLRAQGMEVQVYDSTFGTREELVSKLRQETPGVFAIGVNLMTRASAVRLIGVAVECGWTVVCGGPEPANYAEEYLKAGAHFVVQGEAEVTMQELLTALQAGDDPRGVPGLIFCDRSGAIVRTAPRALIANLDAQPWPDRESIDMNRYLATWRERHGAGSVSLITARGCPYSCRWCSHSTYGHTHRRRSPEGVVDEIAWIAERYRPEMLWIADDVFTIHHGWLFRFAALMQARGLRIPFECITRADRVSAQVARTLAALGCFRVWIGSESGSQRVLDAMERGVTVSQVQHAIELCRAEGIQTGMFLMWGYDGETREDIEQTVAHVKNCRPDVFLTTISYPIKGTPYYRNVGSRVIEPELWKTSSDRDLQIAGRHGAEYYQTADRLLRAEVADSPEAPLLRERLKQLDEAVA